MDDTNRRRIRSFVRREGRLTAAQRRALEQYWPRWGIDFDPQPLDFEQRFGRVADTILEIGFGNGDTLAALAALQPQNNYLGIEVHRPGVGRLLNLIEAQGLGNVRVLCHDAVEVLERQVPPSALSGVNIFFPDPWPKKRHHKRRLIQTAFVDLLSTRMRRGARLHIATDWVPYAQHMEECLAASSHFLSAPSTQAAQMRPQTRFERRGVRLGHEVRDLVYTRA